MECELMLLLAFLAEAHLSYATRFSLQSHAPFNWGRHMADTNQPLDVGAAHHCAFVSAKIV